MFDFKPPLILIQVILLTVQAALYFGIQRFAGAPHRIKTRADTRIPFLPFMIVIYFLWFPMIALFPLMVHHYFTWLYVRHLTALILDIIFSSIIYLIFPTFFRRPSPPDTVAGRLVSFVYAADYTGKNCMPGMSCSMSFIMMFTCAALAPQLPIVLATAVMLVCLLIIISTLLTKQHVIIDIITGLIMALICWFLADGRILM